MQIGVEQIMLDLVDWLLAAPRTHEEVMRAWCRSDYRRRIFEKASRRGLVMAEFVDGHRVVKPTSLGLILGELRREIKSGAARTSNRL